MKYLDYSPVEKDIRMDTMCFGKQNLIITVTVKQLPLMENPLISMTFISNNSQIACTLEFLELCMYVYSSFLNLVILDH